MVIIGFNLKIQFIRTCSSLSTWFGSSALLSKERSRKLHLACGKSILFEIQLSWNISQDTHCPSLKYSFRVVLNFLEYFTNSFFLCSTACLPERPGMKPTTSLTASSSFLIALAISLLKGIRYLLLIGNTFLLAN